MKSVQDIYLSSKKLPFFHDEIVIFTDTKYDFTDIKRIKKLQICEKSRTFVTTKGRSLTY